MSIRSRLRERAQFILYFLHQRRITVLGALPKRGVQPQFGSHFEASERLILSAYGALEAWLARSRFGGSRRSTFARWTSIELLEPRLLLSTVAYWRFENGTAGATIAGPVADELGTNALTVTGSPTYNADTEFRMVPQTLATNY